MKTEFRILRNNIREIQAVTGLALPKPAPSEVLVRIDSFALTANNTTYAATGEIIGYWKFFPVADDPKYGLVPVWGFATVVASANEQIAVGERLFGFWPMASHWVMQPGQITDAGFTDVAAHRADLPPIYNRYRRLASDADRKTDDYLALLYPLFATSYLLNDFMQQNNWFGAKQFIVASASSKTAIGLMQLTAKEAGEGRTRPRIVGLTSPGNHAFVQALGCCDQVVDYEKVADEIDALPAVFVDIAGNIDVRRALHEHLGEQVAYSCAVGTSHWDKFRDAGPMPGAKPRFFFAPAQSEKRRNEWGRDALDAKITQAWLDLSVASKNWMTVAHGVGDEAILDVYRRLANGQTRPDTGHMLALDS